MARTISLAAGADLQQAIDAALPGDTITLAPGATYTGNFKLRKKTGVGVVTIGTAGQTAITTVPSRVKPSIAARFAKVIAPNASPAFRADPGAHHYRLVALEIGVAPGVYNLGVVRFGEGTETRDADLPYELELDRSYVHGDPKTGSKRGVALNGKHLTVKNCWISDFKSVSQDTQAIAGSGGPGPLTIVNNYLEAAAESILFGGATPGIDGVIPSDIEIIGNHLSKPLAWRTYLTSSGRKWLVKNLLELKSARRVRIEGNILENVWEAGQVGFAILIKAEKDNISAVADTSDIVIRNNIIRHAAGGVNICGRLGSSPWTAKRITVVNNLFDDINRNWGSRVRLFSVLDEAYGVTIENNTATPTVAPTAYLVSDATPSGGFVFRSNIVPFGQYGLKGSGQGAGVRTLNYYFPGSIVSHNLVYDAPVGYSSNPPGDIMVSSDTLVGWTSPSSGNWSLAPTSPYIRKGANGAAIGVNWTAILAAVADTLSGI